MPHHLRGSIAIQIPPTNIAGSGVHSAHTSPVPKTPATLSPLVLPSQQSIHHHRSSSVHKPALDLQHMTHEEQPDPAFSTPLPPSPTIEPEQITMPFLK